jgi:hypothetical protein
MDELVSQPRWSGGMTFETLRDLIGTLDAPRTEIQIDVVGIGNEFNAAMRGTEEQEKGARYAQLKTVAHPYFAADRSALLDQLEKSLSPLTYEVVSTDNPSRAGTPLPLDRMRRLDVPLPGATEFLIRVLGGEQPVESRVHLEGGEQLRGLVVRSLREPRRLQLRWRRYGFPDDADSDEPDGLLRLSETFDLSSAPFRPFAESSPEIAIRTPQILVHQPQRYPREQPTGWSFPISIQSGSDSLFSPRPAHIWVEAVPLAGREGTSQQFPGVSRFDRAFSDNRVVPVFAVDVPDWPAAARSCRLDIAFSYSPLPPDWTSDEIRDGLLPRIPNLADVECSVRMGELAATGEFVVVVSELHRGNAPAPVLAQWTMDPPPKRIRRRFFKTSPRIDHEFYFTGTSLPGGARLSVLTRETLLERGLRLPAAWTVDVPAQ